MDLVPEEEPSGFPMRSFEGVDQPKNKAGSKVKRGEDRKKIIKKTLRKYMVILALLTSTTLYAVHAVGNFYETHSTHIQSPVVIRSPIVVEKREPVAAPKEEPKAEASTFIPVAKAAEVEKPAPKPVTPALKPAITEGCEPMRAAIQKYFGELTEAAMVVAKAESGCVQKTTPSPTADYCIFQIHNEPKAGKDLDYCIKRAHDKYVGGRVGANNWSAWYAVCTPGNNPKPKVEGINCI